MANNMKDYQKMFEEETVRLFDNSKINQFPRKGEKMFFYPSNDWGYSPVSLISENTASSAMRFRSGLL